MKKTIGLLTATVFVFMAACNDEKKPVETTTQVPAETKTEVIVVNPAPLPPAVIVKDPPAKATTITLDKNGVKVGTKKVDIEIKREN